LIDVLSTVQIVKKLIEAGASINRKSKDGATPMEVAAEVCFGSLFSLHVISLFSAFLFAEQPSGHCCGVEGSTEHAGAVAAVAVSDPAPLSLTH
jgi:hypothetical protein